MVSTVRQIARHEIAQRQAPLLGVVTSVFESDYTCTVELRESAVVLPHVPIAVGLTGLAGLPRVGDLVIVLFLGGDAHAPVVTGRLYNEQVAPPTNQQGEFVASLPGDETDSSKTLALSVKTPGDGTRSFTLTLDGDVSVKVSIDDTGVILQAQDAKLTLTGGDDGTAELAYSDSKVTIASSGDITITSSGTLKLQGNQIELSADTTMKIGGQTIALN